MSMMRDIIAALAVFAGGLLIGFGLAFVTATLTGGWW
jgi:hypothetical protein